MPERARVRLLDMPNCPRCERELTRHEIGVLYAAMMRTRKSMSHRVWKAKLTDEEVDLIRESKEPIKELAEKHHVSYTTIWRAKNNIIPKGGGELNCPQCGQKLTPEEIGRLFASLGGSTSSPKKAKAAAEKARKRSKLTEEDIANIRQSEASTRELARKYKALLSTIRRIRRSEG